MSYEMEEARLAKLVSLAVLDSPVEQEFDTLTSLAAHLLDCPMAAVSLVDSHRQWFKARHGVDATETSRDVAFCAHAIHYDEIMVVEDARDDLRFAGNPLVTGDPNIRFYAGVPLRPSAPGHSDDLPGIGTLCIIDTRPRKLEAGQRELLQNLAAMVGRLIEARANADEARKLAQALGARAREADRRNLQLRQAERLAGIGSWRLDLVAQALEWSDNVFAIHGLPLGSEPSLDEALSYYAPEDRALVGAQIERAVQLGTCFDFESNLIHADGNVRRVRSVGEPELADGRVVAIIGVFQDITDQHAQVETLRRSAATDGLTGLPNRGAFERELERAIGKAGEEAAPVALMLIDLDGFKAVNDSFGHDAGDEVLREMSRLLRDMNLTQAFPARLGGDEFVLLLSRPRDCAGLESVVAQVVSALTCTVVRDGEVRTVSATVGAALWDGEQPSVELVRNADLALYQAKRARRGTGRIFGAAQMICA